MAIIDCTLVHASTTTTAFIRNYTEVYNVFTDAPTTDLRSIVEYDGSNGGLAIPKKGTGFFYDRISVVQSKTAAPVDGTRQKFMVTVEYGPYDRAGHNSSDEEFDNPLDAPSEYSWGFASRALAMTWDINDNLMVNTAGEPFIPAPEKQEYDLQLTVLQNVQDYEPERSWDLIGKVNDREFEVAGLKVPVKTALLTERSATSQIFVDDEETIRIEYWEVTTILQFRRPNPDWRAPQEIDGLFQENAFVENNAWKKRILNAGLNEQVDVPDPENPTVFTKTKVPIQLDGQPVTEPKLLDVDGAYEDDRLDAIWLPFEIYESADLGSLQL
jgi:hypothetical protein